MSLASSFFAAAVTFSFCNPLMRELAIRPRYPLSNEVIRIPSSVVLENPTDAQSPTSDGC
jgi:hypothetical protein